MDKLNHSLVKNDRRKTLRSSNIINNLNQYMMVIVLIVIIIIFSSMSKYFLTLKNLYAVGLTISVVGIVSIGQTFCIIARGFDLSVGAIAAFSGVVVAYLTNSKIPYTISVLIVIAIGLAIGFINGVLITKGKINALIATLGTMSVITGGVFIVSKGYSIVISQKDFSFLGTARLLGIPLPLIILAILYIIFHVLLKYSLFGKHVYLIGANPEAAKIAGLNVERIQITVFMLCGFLATFGGIMLSSRMGAGNTSAGSSYGLDSISAVILGGTALSGGEGKIHGTLLGVIIIGIIQNGLIMIDMPSYYQFLATGAILIIAVLLQNFYKRW